MLADLSMYDWPEMHAETDAFWAETARRLRATGIEAPGALTRDLDESACWTDPDLLLGQTCGMPFVSGRCGRAVVVARPDYGLTEASDGFYRSCIVVSRQAVAKTGTGAETGTGAVLAQQGCRVAVNEWGSFSGHVTLRAYLAARRGGATDPFFGDAVMSGSHRYSARMVARGEADLAAIDGVAMVMLRRLEPETASMLAVLDLSGRAPALPFITAPAHAGHRAELVAALAGAAAALPSVAGLPCAVAPAGDADYAPIREIARAAAGEVFCPGAPDIPRV